jgi:hypothetical protein
MAIQAIPAVRYTPSATKMPTAQNYLDLDDMNYRTHEIPDLDKNLHGRYGDQMIDTFFEKTGRKSPYASDVVTWTEEERLAQLAVGVTRVGDVFTFVDHTFREGEVITVRDATGAVVRQGRVSATTTTTFTARCGDALGWTALAGALTVFADISEFLKGSLGMTQSLNTKYQQFTARGTITKEMVNENRTNMTQLSWLKMSDSATGNLIGYVWYDINKENAEKRFRNKRESAHFNSKNWAGDLLADGYKGREGLFESMDRGNIYAGFINNVTDVEGLIDRLEKQGQHKDNIIYGTTAFCLAQDRFLASTNTVGLSYGAFQNSKDMALDLSFQGYKLGGYEFSYSKLQYLTEATAQGSMIGAKKVNGFMIPSGSASVKDNMTGTTSMKPMIHVRHRAYGAMNRDYEMVTRDWAQGTSLTDTITTEFQSEQLTCLIAANNTVKFMG